MSSEVTPFEENPVTAIDVRTSHWSPLRRALTTLELAEPLTTPVYSAMALGAAGSSIALCCIVSMWFIPLAGPLTIVAMMLLPGTIVKSVAKKLRRRAARRGRRKRRGEP